MKLMSRLSRGFILSILFAISFGIVSVLVVDKQIQEFDSVIVNFVQDKESPGLTNAMKIFTNIGSGSIVAIITIITILFLYFVLHHRMEIILFVFVLAGSAILNVVLKIVFHRERPTIHRLITESGYGFPSGHSMGAFSLYGIIAFLLWKHVPALWGRTMLILMCCSLILAIGISRIYLGVHYPSDVLAGYMASGFWLMASIWVYQRYRERSFKKAYI